MPGNDDIQLIVGHEDVSAFAEEPSWSAADPGGFEAASMRFPRNVRIPRGTDVKILYGNGTAWEGRVNEVNRQLSAQPNTQIACQGYGARYKENGKSMIFVDRDSSRWRGPGVGRQIAVTSAGTDIDGGTVGFDATVKQAGLQLQITGTWARAHVSELWYDGGPSNLVAAIYYTVTNNALISLADANWGLQFFSCATDDGSTSFTLETPDLIPGTGVLSPNNQYVNLAAPIQFLIWQLKYVTGPAGGEAQNYAVFVSNLAVYGDHGLPIAGDAPGGYTPDQIAAYVQKVSQTGIVAGVIEPSAYIIPHLVYYTDVPWEQMIDDAAKLAGFHWGTWEGPALHFRSYPGTPTCWTDSVSVDDLQINDSLDGLFNVAKISYRDTAGTQGTVTCTRSVAALDEADITRTLFMDLGIGTSFNALAFGNIVLAISERNASSSGSFTTKLPVMATGGDRPAFMLRPGIDRMKITDLSADGDGQTEFIVKRIEATPSSDGITTSVELGRGADLIQALQSRLEAGMVGQ